MVRYLFTWVRENRQIWHYKLLSRHEKWSSSILHLCEQTELRWWVFFVTKHDLPSLEIIKDDADKEGGASYFTSLPPLSHLPP